MNLLLLYFIVVFQWFNTEESGDRILQIQKPRQPKNSLDYIKDYQIKIDGGGSYYTFDTTSLDKKKHIFVISAGKTSFISLKNQSEYVYLDRVTKEDLPDGSVREVFKGNGYTALLKTKKATKINHYSSLHKGILIISNRKASTTFKVHGIVEE